MPELWAKAATWGRDSIASLWKVGVTAHHNVNTFLTVWNRRAAMSVFDATAYSSPFSTSFNKSRAEDETRHSGKAKTASGSGKSGGIGKSRASSTDSSATSGFTFDRYDIRFFFFHRLRFYIHIIIFTSSATYRSFFMISRASVRSFSQIFEA